MKFSYTLQSIKKHIEFDLDKESYTQEQANNLLKRLCGAIDISILDSKVERK